MIYPMLQGFGNPQHIILANYRIIICHHPGCFWNKEGFPSLAAFWGEVAWPRYKLDQMMIYNSSHSTQQKNWWPCWSHFTPWKINMELTNHPFRKENDLKQTSMIVMFHFNLQGCTLPPIMMKVKNGSPSSIYLLNTAVIHWTHEYMAK